MGKSTINGPFSIAMLVITRGYTLKLPLDQSTDRSEVSCGFFPGPKCLEFPSVTARRLGKNLGEWGGWVVVCL